MEVNSGVKNRANASKEVICRVLFTLNALTLAGSLLIYVQTEYQLVSSLIPRHTIDLIAGPYLKAALVVAILHIPSLWFYFFRRLTVVIMLQALSLLGFILVQVV
jgi:hypothetical protein